MTKKLSKVRRPCRTLFTASVVATLALTGGIATAQTSSSDDDKKPNILFIMGDDIGLYNVGVYHRTLLVGETPNIDRIANC